MWDSGKFTLPSVLIVENKSGDVFIVEDKKNTNQIEKILGKDFKAKQTPELDSSSRESSSPDIITESLQLDDCDLDDDDNQDETLCVDLPTSSEIECEIDPDILIKDEIDEEIQNLDSHWSSNDGSFDDFEGLDECDIELNLNDKLLDEEETKLKHYKIRNLVGKPACKYCDTVFKSRAHKSVHKCRYLRCDPNNFICRICHKELSKQTFSNHLHETSDCQYCKKSFVNPRNLARHIAKQHKDEEFVPQQRKNYDQYIKWKEEQEKLQVDLREEQKERKKYKRKSVRYECDLCGKYLFSLRSMHFHMSLHTGKTCYICENCGEKFYTPNGIKNHSCEKKRRRPEKDFRTYDQRYCRFCDKNFLNLDKKKAHKCAYQNPEDPKTVFCRICNKLLNKLAYNRHMEIHSGVDWMCNICDRKLATQRALKVHLTTHTGNKPYKCKQCTETFINKVVLERHMRFHGASSKVYRCQFCSKDLSSETSLKNHIQRVHDTSAQCELCKEIFPSRDHLKDHLNLAHEPSICQLCQKSFALPRYLRMHEKLHYDDSTAKISCQFCTKMLIVKYIKSHIYRAHPEQFVEWQKVNPNL